MTADRPDNKAAGENDPTLAGRNIRTALWLAACAVGFFVAFFVVMS